MRNPPVTKYRTFASDVISYLRMQDGWKRIGSIVITYYEKLTLKHQNIDPYIIS